MKLICFDITYCGYQESLNKASKETNIDLNQKVIECPSCLESLALIEDDDFTFETKTREEKLKLQIELFEKLIKL